MIDPLPLWSRLDPRPESEAEARPLLESVNIPMSELRNRVFELPRKGSPLVVVAEPQLAQACQSLLLELGFASSTETSSSNGAPTPEPCMPGLGLLLLIRRRRSR